RTQRIARDESLALGRRLRLDLSPNCRRTGRAAVPARRAAYAGPRPEVGSLDGHCVLADQLAERVADELEIFRPEQRQQIVGRVRLEILGLLEDAEKANDLEILDTGFERERAHAVLEQRPRNAFVALVLIVDDVVFPAHL